MWPQINFSNFNFQNFFEFRALLRAILITKHPNPRNVCEKNIRTQESSERLLYVRETKNPRVSCSMKERVNYRDG